MKVLIIFLLLNVNLLPQNIKFINDVGSGSVTAPEAITSFTATGGAGIIDIDWEGGAGATYYQIYASQDTVSQSVMIKTVYVPAATEYQLNLILTYDGVYADATDTTDYYNDPLNFGIKRHSKWEQMFPGEGLTFYNKMHIGQEYHFKVVAVNSAGTTESDWSPATASSGIGTTYYFSNTGDDVTGDGSKGNPWATIDKFNSIIGINQVRTGITYLFKGGDTFADEQIFLQGVRSIDGNQLVHIGSYGKGQATITVDNGSPIAAISTGMYSGNKTRHVIFNNLHVVCPTSGTPYAIRPGDVNKFIISNCILESAEAHDSLNMVTVTGAPRWLLTFSAGSDTGIVYNNLFQYGSKGVRGLGSYMEHSFNIVRHMTVSPDGNRNDMDGMSAFRNSNLRWNEIYGCADDGIDGIYPDPDTIRWFVTMDGLEIHGTNLDTTYSIKAIKMDGHEFTIRNCKFYDYDELLWDENGNTHLLQLDGCFNFLVHNNLFWNNLCGGISAWRSSNMKIYNNTLVNTGSYNTYTFGAGHTINNQGGIMVELVDSGGTSYIQNNIVDCPDDGGIAEFHLTRFSGSQEIIGGYNHTANEAISLSGGVTYTETANSDVEATTVNFVNRASGNFRLQNTSASYRTGVSWSGIPATDMYGEPVTSPPNRGYSFE